MGFAELLLIGVGLSMDAFAVAVCKVPLPLFQRRRLSLHPGAHRHRFSMKQYVSRL